MELNSSINYDREKLRKFIVTYRNLPILWDSKCPNYSKKDKRCEAYEELLQVYRAINNHATIMDLKKKINSMRSNFRKEMKKVEESAAIGIHYRPSSWMYDELLFLNDCERSYTCANSLYDYSGTKPPTTVVVSDEEDSGNDDVLRSCEKEIPVISSHQYSSKRSRYSESNQDDSLASETQFSDKRLPKNTDSYNCDGPSPNVFIPSISYNDDLAKVWSAKLKYLPPLQRLFAEKAINDILFEAQLGTLHRNSVKINIMDETRTTSNIIDEIRMTEPSQSSPEYKFSQSYGFTEDHRK